MPDETSRRPPELGELSRASVSRIDAAHDIAERRGSTTVDPADLLVSVLDGGGAPADSVRALGADPDAIKARLIKATVAGEGIGRGERVSMGDAAKQVVYEAIREARLLGHHAVDPFHILLALSYRDTGPAAAALGDAGVTLVDLRMYAQGRAGAEDRRSEGHVKRLQRRATPRFSDQTRPSAYFLVPVGAMLAGGLGLWFGGGQFITVFTLLFVAGGWVTSLCIHEFSHALAGYFGGDRGVAQAGYLTLNPMKYTHPVLSLGIPLLFLFLGGIGLPGGAVFINRAALRSKGWDSFVSLAGPLGSLACLLLLAWPFLFLRQWFTVQSQYFFYALALLAFLEVTAIFFNLLPIPPLDGWGIIAPYLSPELRFSAARLGFMPMLLVFALFYIPEVSAAFFGFMYGATEIFQVPRILVEEGFLAFPRLRF